MTNVLVNPPSPLKINAKIRVPANLAGATSRRMGMVCHMGTDAERRSQRKAQVRQIRAADGTGGGGGGGGGTHK